MNRSVVALLGCATLVVSHAALAAKPDAAGIEFFESKIRPVLVERCYKCHSKKSQQEGKLEGKLLLDSREGALQGGENGAAVVPGNVAESLLIQAIRHESFEMPPKTKLPARVIADFVRWVEMGAPDPREGAALVFPDSAIDLVEGRKFWSYQPLVPVAPPEVKNTAWARTPVDRFILARQEAEGITPGKMAARRTLVRRAYFDLWGLPPTPAEVEAFLSDTAPDAYERLVDRLLAGQHYGERWARHWLDLARFAESNGYAFDKDRAAAYHYRDFVIRALNEGMPYDRFIKLQMAGDLIAPGEYMAQAATGFLAAGTFTSQQTQKERERSRYEQLDDLIVTIGTATLGLNLGCARCHDHKYDPVPRYDYYRLISAFSETGFQDAALDLKPEVYKNAKAKFDQEHKPFVDARAKFEKEQIPGRLAKWIAQRPAQPAAPQLSPWQAVGPFQAKDFNKAYDEVLDPEKAVLLAATYNEGKLKWTAHPEWADAKVHNLAQGDRSVTYLYRTINADSALPVELSLGADDGVKLWLNGKLVTEKKQIAAKADQLKPNVMLRKGENKLLIKVVNNTKTSGFYFAVKRSGPPKNIADVLALAAEKRTAAQTGQLHKWVAPLDDDWQKLNRAEQQHLASAPKPNLTKIFAAKRGGTTYNFGADTRKVYFLSRGNSNRKLGLASPGFIQVLMSGEEQEKRWLVDAESGAAKKNRPPRIAFADWLTDAENGAGHLLARVIVNRLWQHHFGQGIVATPSDFGAQGLPPTHPELVNYLAAELVRGGWKLKPFHKLIMTSAVYMQGGESNPSGIKNDPDNKLLWRHPAKRIEAEIIRDTLLSVSGLLDKKMYGPGSLNEQDPRRSVYLKVKRSVLIPILQLFDAPDAIQGIGQRSVTTVAPQTLAMINSPFVRQLAEKFSRRVRPAADTPLEKVVEDAYAIALSRPPTDEETSRMLQFIDGQAKSYGNDPKATDTAVADFCQLVMCLNEFIYVD